jgi:hypothetical protein
MSKTLVDDSSDKSTLGEAFGESDRSERLAW